MSISIDIDGFDKLKRELESLERGLSFETIDFWTNRLLNDVKLTGPPNLVEQVEIKAIRNSEGNIEIEFHSPLELIEIIIETVRKYLSEMPLTTRVFFEKFIEVVENKAKVSG